MQSDISKYLRYFVLTMVSAVLFVPLVVFNESFFPFITGKNFVFRVLVELAFGGWLSLLVIDKKYRPKMSYILWSFTALIAVMSISTLFSENSFKSFWSNFERMEGLITHLHLFAYFLVLSSIIRSDKDWERFFQTTLFVSVIIFFYGLFQLAGKIDINQGGVGLDATFGNAAYLAIYCLFHFFIAGMFLFRKWKNVTWRWIYGTIMIMNLVSLYFTATRGSILGVIGGTLLSVILLAILEKDNKIFRKTAIITLVVVAVFSFLIFALKNTPVIKNSQTLGRLSSMSFSDKTTQSRFIIWGMALEGVKERPVLGWGFENFNYVFNKYYNPKIYSSEQWFDRAHNVFFDWLITGGIFGFLSYMSLLFFGIYMMWKSPHLSKRDKAILSGLFAGYFFNNLFVFDNITSYIMLFSVLGFVHAKSVYNHNDEIHQHKDKEDSNPDPMFIAKLTTPLIFALVLVYFVNANGWSANKNLIKALETNNDPVKRLDYLKKTVELDSFGTSEAMEQIAMLARGVISNQNIPDDIKNQYFNFSINEMLKQIERTPNDARYYLFAGSYLSGYGNYTQALPILKKAVELSPKKQTIRFELVSHYLSQNNVAQAVEEAKYAFELEKEFGEARIIYAISLIIAGRDAEADQVLTEGFGSPIVADRRLVQVYTVKKNTNSVIQTLSKMIEVNPSDTDSMLSLASVYAGVGNKTKAIDLIKKIIEIKPEFSAQGEQYIKEIQLGIR